MVDFVNDGLHAEKMMYRPFAGISRRPIWEGDMAEQLGYSKLRRRDHSQ